MAPFSLAGKTAVITGAGSGIGLAIANIFADAGAAVRILDVSQAAIDAAVAGINKRCSVAAAGFVPHLAVVASKRLQPGDLQEHLSVRYPVSI